MSRAVITIDKVANLRSRRPPADGKEVKMSSERFKSIVLMCYFTLEAAL